jgi:opacity protein-like surface antigen
MKRLRLFLLLVPIATVCAQSREIWVDAGQTLIANHFLGTDQIGEGSKNDLQLNNGFRFGVRFDVNQGEHIGHEFQYANSRAQLQYNYQPGEPKLGSAINRFGYDLLGYFTRRGSKLRPFGAIGGQWSNFAPPHQSYLGCESLACTIGSAAPGSPIVTPPPAKLGYDKFGFNYGGGVKVMVRPRVGLRLDVRQYVNGKPFNLPAASGLLRQTEVSGGIGYAF